MSDIPKHEDGKPMEHEAIVWLAENPSFIESMEQAAAIERYMLMQKEDVEISKIANNEEMLSQGLRQPEKSSDKMFTDEYVEPSYGSTTDMLNSSTIFGEDVDVEHYRNLSADDAREEAFEMNRSIDIFGLNSEYNPVGDDIANGKSDATLTLEGLAMNSSQVINAAAMYLFNDSESVSYNGTSMAHRTSRRLTADMIESASRTDNEYGKKLLQMSGTREGTQARKQFLTDVFNLAKPTSDMLFSARAVNETAAFAINNSVFNHVHGANSSHRQSVGFGKVDEVAEMNHLGISKQGMVNDGVISSYMNDKVGKNASRLQQAVEFYTKRSADILTRFKSQNTEEAYKAKLEETRNAYIGKVLEGNSNLLFPSELNVTGVDLTRSIGGGTSPFHNTKEFQASVYAGKSNSFDYSKAPSLANQYLGFTPVAGDFDGFKNLKGKQKGEYQLLKQKADIFSKWLRTDGRSDSTLSRGYNRDITQDNDRREEIERNEAIRSHLAITEANNYRGIPDIGKSDIHGHLDSSSEGVTEGTEYKVLFNEMKEKLEEGSAYVDKDGMIRDNSFGGQYYTDLYGSDLTGLGKSLSNAKIGTSNLEGAEALEIMEVVPSKVKHDRFANIYTVKALSEKYTDKHGLAVIADEFRGAEAGDIVGAANTMGQDVSLGDKPYYADIEGVDSKMRILGRHDDGVYTFLQVAEREKTDRDKYLDLKADAPEPNSKEWFEARALWISASDANKFTDSKGMIKSSDDKVVTSKVIKALTGDIQPKDSSGNAYTRRGHDKEERAARTFQAQVGDKKGWSLEEGFFYSGESSITGKEDVTLGSSVGATFDYVAFDDKGDMQAVIEIKNLEGESYHKAIETYSDQVQVQMAKAGVDTGYLVVQRHDGDLERMIVEIEADKGRQKLLLNAMNSGTRKIQRLHDELIGDEEIAGMAKNAENDRLKLERLKEEERMIIQKYGGGEYGGEVAMAYKQNSINSAEMQLFDTSSKLKTVVESHTATPSVAERASVINFDKTTHEIASALRELSSKLGEVAKDSNSSPMDYQKVAEEHKVMKQALTMSKENDRNSKHLDDMNHKASPEGMEEARLLAEKRKNAEFERVKAKAQRSGQKLAGDERRAYEQEQKERSLAQAQGQKMHKAEREAAEEDAARSGGLKRISGTFNKGKMAFGKLTHAIGLATDALSLFSSRLELRSEMREKAAKVMASEHDEASRLQISVGELGQAKYMLEANGVSKSRETVSAVRTLGNKATLTPHIYAKELAEKGQFVAGLQSQEASSAFSGLLSGAGELAGKTLVEQTEYLQGIMAGLPDSVRVSFGSQVLGIPAEQAHDFAKPLDKSIRVPANYGRNAARASQHQGLSSSARTQFESRLLEMIDSNTLTLSQARNLENEAIKYNAGDNVLSRLSGMINTLRTGETVAKLPDLTEEEENDALRGRWDYAPHQREMVLYRAKRRKSGVKHESDIKEITDMWKYASDRPVTDSIPLEGTYRRGGSRILPEGNINSLVSSSGSGSPEVNVVVKNNNNLTVKKVGENEFSLTSVSEVEKEADNSR